ncbi:MAG: HD domain-containing protein [Lachnospiraceae bacterium]|nr:HD domain-containing protein [Lachnospiraceae bacterium]
MDIERLQKQFAFILEMDKEKQIERRTHIHGYSRHETDAEHAWHMALMVMLLSEYANEKIDVLHTIEMLLIHDLVEIDAGDTYAYDAKGNETKAQRELAAAERIYGLLPEDQGKRLRALWDEFEESKTPEAKFAHVMDNIQPMMLNAANDGKDWKSHGVRLEQILKRNEITPEGSNELWTYAKDYFIAPHIAKGNILE